MAYLGRGLDKISNIEVLDNITFDGSSSYSITKGSVAFTPNSAQSLLISIDGVVQATNFTVNSSTIDFGVAIPSTSVCNFFLHYGTGVMTVPSDGSVSLAKLTATGTKDATTFLRGDNTFASAGLSGWSENGSNNDLLPANASAGIYLGVNSATAANLLDDYEEGTWTPAWSFGSGSVSYFNQIGRYTKIGRTVTITLYMNTSGISSPSGNATITGLPFTNDQETGCAIGIIYRWNTDFDGDITFLIGQYTSVIYPYKQASTAEAALLQGSDFLDGSSKNIISLSTTYQTT